MKVLLLMKIGAFLLITKDSGASESSSNTTSTPITVTTTENGLTNSSLAAIIELTPTDIPCADIVSPCPLSEGLVCQKGFCKCAYPHLSYDAKNKKCLAKLGEQCGFFIGLKNASTVACTTNAVCAIRNLEMLTDGQNQYSSHQCACVYTHYQNDLGECVPLAGHGEQCDAKRKCNSESELICLDGICQCQFGSDQYFDTEKGSCVSYAGGNCTRSCVQNSQCDFWGIGKCQCRLDHRPNSDKYCEPIPPGYLSSCLGEKELCNLDAGLRCIDKVCQCANPLHQMYDFQLDKCIGLAGDICDPKLLNNCVRNASCTLKEKGKEDHVCKCVEGYSTTPFRKCMKSHEQKCSNEFCNVYRGLACINGRCECYDSFLKYDITSEACRSSVGSPCGKIFVPFPGEWVKISCPECDSYYFACNKDSICTRDFSEGNEIGALEKFRCQPKNVL